MILTFVKSNYLDGLCFAGGVIFGCVTILVGPAVGYGQVDEAPWAYSHYLDVGKIYVVHAALKTDHNQVILVQEAGKDKFLALRVAGPLPPRRFVLVGGVPTSVK